MNTIFRTGSVVMFFSLVLMVAVLADSKPQGAAAETKVDSWKAARAALVQRLSENGISEQDIEQPKWFENFYSTIGRMPLVDEVMGKPFAAPEVAMYFDDQCRENAESLSSLLYVADAMRDSVMQKRSEISVADIYNKMLKEKRIDASVSALLEKIAADKKIPGVCTKATEELVMGVAAADALRKEAFAKLAREEYKRVGELLPQYFLPVKNGERVFRAYTAENLDDCVELIFLIQKCDLAALHLAGEIMAKASDNARRIVKSGSFVANKDGIIFETKTPFGDVIICGGADNIYQKDYAVIIDLGGNDTYLNNAGGTSPDGPGAAVVLDIAGDDTYSGRDFCQGAGYCGVGVLMDLSGNDTYTARYYSQCATLLGYSFFYEGGGDDAYNGDLGLQSFAIFGYSIMSERGGNDTYRCSSMGQGSSSTLGVAILAEGAGDDVYSSGGKYGFYTNVDSSCSQGASSGMRPWPTIGKLTLYGGVSLLSEAKGNDKYCAYTMAQGGAYILALGMAVDSEGNDFYIGADYAQGAGCHLAAGVLVDRAGNDLYNGKMHSIGHSLDRSVGVMLDLAGNDVYKTEWGIGYAGKPRGTAIFVDAEGNDIYDGNDTVGYARPTYGEHINSVSFFMDMKGKDKYPNKKFSDNRRWQQDEWGFGEDTESVKAAEGLVKYWTPAMHEENTKEKWNSWSVYERFNAIGAILNGDPAKRFEFASNMAAESGNPLACLDLVDALEILRIRKEINIANTKDIITLLKSKDRNLRLMACRLGWISGLRDSDMTKAFGNTIVSDNSFEVRSMAAMALGMSRYEIAFKPLCDATRDRSWVTRRRVAIAFGILGKIVPGVMVQLGTMLKDSDYRVRAQAARSLGMMQDPSAVALLKRALKDKSEFVQLNAAQALLLGYNVSDGMPVLVRLMKWSNTMVRAEEIWPLLKSISGADLGNDPKLWADWWSKARKGFDAKKYIETARKIGELAKLDAQKRLPEVVGELRELLKAVPGHVRVKAFLAKALNQTAWSNAVKGTELKESLAMAEEAVTLAPQTAYMDTLSVLKFLNGDIKGAKEVIGRAIKAAKPDEKQFYEDRLLQFESGKLKY